MTLSLDSRVRSAPVDRGEYLGSRLLITGMVLAFSLGGFWLRLLYAFNHDLHPDEYTSLLVARGIVERGIVAVLGSADDIDSLGWICQGGQQEI